MFSFLPFPSLPFPSLPFNLPLEVDVVWSTDGPVFPVFVRPLLSLRSCWSVRRRFVQEHISCSNVQLRLTKIIIQSKEFYAQTFLGSTTQHMKKNKKKHKTKKHNTTRHVTTQHKPQKIMKNTNSPFLSS